MPPYETFSAEVGAGANALFSLSLDYEPNGNIREASWKTTYHAPNTYVYEYDDLNRLTDADYSTASGGGGMFSVAGISYDGIGNILSLNRKGVTACNDDGELETDYIDKLIYSYGAGSQLTSINDQANHPDLKDLGVKSGGGGYEYDDAGRMTADGQRGITKIEYNHLDLPRKIIMGGTTVEITYDATGRKWLEKTTTPTENTSRIYAGALTFAKDGGSYQLEAANVGDGRLVYDEEFREVYTEYHHKDHLGNVRLAFTDRNEDQKVELLDDASEITQQNDYYPFGLRQEGGELVFHHEVGGNRYRYNGKELNEDLGLYDYGARWYDPAIGRWGQIDPLAEKFTNWSPYNYVYNNPIAYIDPDGRQGDLANGITIWFQKDESISNQQLLQAAINYIINVHETWGDKGTDGGSNITFKFAGEDFDSSDLGDNGNLVTFGNFDGPSRVFGDKQQYSEMNVQGGSENTAAHEFGHHLGLSDRYLDGMASSPTKNIGKRITTPIGRDGINDPDYDPSDNLYSSGSKTLTPFQLNIANSPAVEQDYQKNRGILYDFKDPQNPSKINYRVVHGKVKGLNTGRFKGAKSFQRSVSKSILSRNLY